MDDLSISPQQAVKQLKCSRFLNASEAVWRLRSLAECADVLCLYHHYFPAEYAASTASTMPDPDAGRAYSPRELEFMELAESRLFPIAYDLMADADERFFSIPICSQAIDVEEARELRPGLQALIGLIGGPYADVDWKTLLALATPGSGPPLNEIDAEGQYEVDWDQFDARCARIGKPMQKVGAAFSIVTYSTNNLWLDCTDEMMSYSSFEFPWTVEAVDFLTAEWRRADALLDQLNTVLDWLETRPNRITQLVAAWNGSLRKKQTQANEVQEGDRDDSES